MIYRKQLFAHMPEIGQYGDCYRTCIACLLDREPRSVPHFTADFATMPENPETTKLFDAVVNKWLAKEGYAKLELCYRNDAEGGDFFAIAQYIENLNGPIRYMVGGRSEIGNHVVVYEGKRMIHDPAPSGKGLIGPCPDGYFWVTFLLPASMRGDHA